MEQTNNISTQQNGSVFDTYRQTLPTVFRHPATWLLTFLWLLATIYLFVVGNKLLPITLLFSGLAVVFSLLTLLLTQGAPSDAWETPAPSSQRGRLWLQSSLVLLLALLPALLALLSDLNAPIPWLFPFYTAFRTSALIKLVLAFLPPIAVLVLVLLLGARWRELGFQKGYHSGRVIAVLNAPFIVFFVFALAAGRIALPVLLLRIVLEFFTAGLPEEIVWRGVLMSRLRRLLGTGWGIALSSLIFGLIHVGTNIAVLGMPPLAAVAQTIASQLPAGLLFAVIFLRTRSLAAGIIVHSLTDVVGPMLLSL